jgi:hypothetical protein
VVLCAPCTRPPFHHFDRTDHGHMLLSEDRSTFIRVHTCTCSRGLSGPSCTRSLRYSVRPRPACRHALSNTCVAAPRDSEPCTPCIRGCADLFNDIFLSSVTPRSAQSSRHAGDVPGTGMHPCPQILQPSQTDWPRPQIYHGDVYLPHLVETHRVLTYLLPLSLWWDVHS